MNVMVRTARLLGLAKPVARRPRAVWMIDPRTGRPVRVWRIPEPAEDSSRWRRSPSLTPAAVGRGNVARRPLTSPGCHPIWASCPENVISAAP